MMMNMNDLNTVKGLLHQVSVVMLDTDLSADVAIIDSNGEKMGDIQLLDGEYQFIPQGGA